MTSVPSYQRFTNRRLEENPAKKTKKRKILTYKVFFDGELASLDELLHKENVDLSGVVCDIISS